MDDGGEGGGEGGDELQAVELEGARRGCITFGDFGCGGGQGFMMFLLK